MKEKLNIALVFFILICFFRTSAYAQSDSAIADTLRHDENVIKNSESLMHFYSKLNSYRENPEQINILHLGDSHIEMGYFVEEARRCFKVNFDLAGFGMLFPYQLAKSIPYFVQTKATKGVWDGKCYLKSESDFKYGVAGFTINTRNKEAEFEMQAVKCDSSILSGNKIVIYYSSDDSSSITVHGVDYSLDSINKLNPIDFETEIFEGDNFQFKKTTYYFNQSINKVIVSVNQLKDSIPFYISGVQLLNQDKAGVIYHNCGVVGATFKQLSKNSSLSIVQMLDINPDLIIFSYGSNEAYEPNFNGADYYLAVTNYIQRVKNTLPNASIILTTPPDTRSNGRFPINNIEICNVLKKVAKEQNIALWNLHDQMGGTGSMLKWLNKGLASKDKLHFKKLGYELQAKMFIYALFKDYNKIADQNNSLIVPFYSTDFKN
jgi:lysophospholipase L1-like esterase